MDVVVNAVMAVVLAVIVNSCVGTGSLACFILGE
jgi:hypothetical protein